MVLSPALVRVLTAGRPHFNARVAEVRHWHAGFDTEAFAEFVASGIDPIAVAVEQTMPERTAQVVSVAYDVALDLVAQGLAGPNARLPWIDRVWAQLAPAYARRLAEQPKDVLGVLTNAAVNLSGVPGVRVGEWLVLMRRWAPHAPDLASLRTLALIAAWRSGMAHFREMALIAADSLPETALLDMFDAVPGRRWRDVHDRYRASPWWDEATHSLRTDGMEAGGFSGFGGPFPQPPQVRVDAGGFLLRSGDRCSRLIADAYGVTFLAVPEAEYDAAPALVSPSPAELSGSRLHIGARAIDLDLPAERLVLVWDAHTLVASSPYAHTLRLWPLTGA